MIRRRKERKSPLLWIIPVVLVVLLVSGFFFLKYQFKVKKINISGSDKYSYEELYNHIFENRNSTNTLLFKKSLKDNPIPDIPFIAKVSVDISWPGTINIEVYEKSIIGYIVYQSSYMYFDKDGIVVESSPKLIAGIPEISGLNFNHIVLYEKLDVKDTSVFRSIMDIKQYLEKYNIMTDKIEISDESEFSISIGNIRVLLGKSDSMMSEKIYEISCMSEQFGTKKGTLDMREYTKDSKYVILTEEK